MIACLVHERVIPEFLHPIVIPTNHFISPIAIIMRATDIEIIYYNNM